MNKSSDEDDDGLRTTNPVAGSTTTVDSKIGVQQTDAHLERTNSLSFIPGQVERKRRKLPEIPKNKKCKFQIFYQFYI